MDDAPLILTLRLDLASAARFEAERMRHFPPARNLIPAHLTLFHHLPGEHQPEISRQLASIAALQSPFAMTVPSLRFLGEGTAYNILSAELVALRASIAGLWAARLTRQDAAGFRPHVTIQNKVSAPAAKALFESLSAGFEPFTIEATGLLLWRYRAGPWEAAGEYAFQT